MSDVMVITQEFSSQRWNVELSLSKSPVSAAAATVAHIPDADTVAQTTDAAAVTTLHEALEAFCFGRAGGLDQRVPTAHTTVSKRCYCTNELLEVTVSVNESDVEDVVAIAHEFGILGHIQIEVSGAQEPASSRLLFGAAIADAHADSTGEAALDIARLELRRIIWNSGSQETQVMYVHPPTSDVTSTTEASSPSLSASPGNHPELAAAEIWVCVPPHLFARMQCKVAELTGALGTALHYRMRVFALEETDLAKHPPAPGVERLRFTHDTAVFGDACPRFRTAAIAIPSSKGDYPVSVSLNDSTSVPPRAIATGKFRGSSSGGYVQIGDGRGESMPIVVVDSCGHPLRLDAVGAAVLKDTLLAPDDSSNDISITPLAVSFPGLSSSVPMPYGDMVWNSGAIPAGAAAPRPQMLPRRAFDVVCSAVDFGVYRMQRSGSRSPPCTASDMEPQPFVSHALPVSVGRMTIPVRCLPDARNYMGPCRFHGINTPEASSTNMLDVIGFGEKVLSIKIPGRVGFHCAVEATYIARHTGGGAEPTEGDSGGDVESDAQSGAYCGEAPLLAFICSRAMLSCPAGSIGAANAPVTPPTACAGASNDSSAAPSTPSPTTGGQPGVSAVNAVQEGVSDSTLRTAHEDAKDLCVPTVATSSTASASRSMPALGGAIKDRAVYPVEAALGSASMSASASVERAFGCTLFTLTPAHLALGFVEIVQDDSSYNLPPGVVTFVRPRRAAAA